MRSNRIHINILKLVINSGSTLCIYIYMKSGRCYSNAITYPAHIIGKTIWKSDSDTIEVLVLDFNNYLRFGFWLAQFGQLPKGYHISREV